MIKRSPILSDQLCDIQGMLNSGFGWLTESRFWLLTIRDGQEHQARAWLAKLVRGGLVVSAKRVRDRKKNERTPITEAVAIAFSYSGLAKLGFRENKQAPISDPVSQRHGKPLAEIIVERHPAPAMAVVGRRRMRTPPDRTCRRRQLAIARRGAANAAS